MTLEVGTDTYASVDDIQAYLDARGHALEVTEAAVLRAMDYIESLPWTTTPVCALHWGSAPPPGVVSALCDAVRIETETPHALAPTSEQGLKAMSVGPISLNFGGGEGKETFPSILRHLQGLLVSPCTVKRVLV